MRLAIRWGLAAGAFALPVGWGFRQHAEIASLRSQAVDSSQANERAARELRRLSLRLDALEEGVSANVSDRSDVDAVARTRFREGVQAYDAGDYELARESFQRAYESRRNPAVLLNLAWSCLRSGHLIEAERYFSHVLEDPDSTDKQREGAMDGRARCKSETASAPAVPPTAPAPHAATPALAAALPALPPSVPEGYLTINSIPPSTVILDGAYLGPTPRVHVGVKPGAHTVQFVAEGMAKSVNVDVAAGETKQAVVKLAMPPPEPSQTAQTSRDGF